MNISFIYTLYKYIYDIIYILDIRYIYKLRRYSTIYHFIDVKKGETFRGGRPQPNFFIFKIHKIYKLKRYINPMKVKVLIQIDEEVVKAMDDAHINKSAYINEILQTKFGRSTLNS